METHIAGRSPFGRPAGPVLAGRPRQAPPRARPHRRRDLRPAGGGRRLQRAVDRADRQGARPASGMSSSSRAARWAGPPRAATAASAPPPSPTAWPTASPAGRTRSTSSRNSAPATSTRSRRRSPGTPSTATSSAPARSTSPPNRTRPPNSAPGTRRWRSKGLATGIEFLDTEAVREQVASPTFLAGLHDRTGVAMLNPAKLAWGLKRACLRLGVRVYEHTPALDPAAVRRRQWPYARPTGRSAPAGSRSARTSFRTWSSGCARTRSPSTTTR